MYYPDLDEALEDGDPTGDAGLLLGPIGDVIDIPILNLSNLDPEDALRIERCQEAVESDFWLLVPDWAKSEIWARLTGVDENNAFLPTPQYRAKHLDSALNCCSAINGKQERQIARFGLGKKQAIKRHKRTRAEIRAAKGQK